MSLESARRRLSANDLGVTGSHQAGFLIPKRLIREGLFPQLETTQLNPRSRLKLVQKSQGNVYFLSFIYYNNKVFGGTRDEYRLTGVSSILRDYGLRVGDQIEFFRIGVYDFEFEIIKQDRESTFLDADSWKLIYGE